MHGVDEPRQQRSCRRTHSFAHNYYKYRGRIDALDPLCVLTAHPRSTGSRWSSRGTRSRAPS
jgi:hypothetical protein